MTKKERKGNDKVKANGKRLCPLSTSRLVSPKLSQVFVRRKLQFFFFFTMGDTVAPRSNIQIFQTGSYKAEATEIGNEDTFLYQ